MASGGTLPDGGDCACNGVGNGSAREGGILSDGESERRDEAGCGWSMGGLITDDSSSADDDERKCASNFTLSSGLPCKSPPCAASSENRVGVDGGGGGSGDKDPACWSCCPHAAVHERHLASWQFHRLHDSVHGTDVDGQTHTCSRSAPKRRMTLRVSQCARSEPPTQRRARSRGCVMATWPLSLSQSGSRAPRSRGVVAPGATLLPAQPAAHALAPSRSPPLPPRDPRPPVSPPPGAHGAPLP